MAHLVYDVACDWNGDGEFDHRYSDLSDATRTFSVKRGSSGIREIVAPGTALIQINNLEGLYSPLGTSSLAARIIPGRAVRITAQVESDAGVVSGPVIPIYYGYLSRATAISATNRPPIVELHAYDAIDALRYGKVSIDLTEGQRADQLINLVLDAAGWPSGLRDIQRASPKSGRIPYFWGEDNAPSALLREAVKSDPGGQLWIKANGYVAFSNSRARHHAVPRGTLGDSQYTLKLASEVSREDVYDNIVFAGAGLSSGASGVLYTDAPGRRILPPGDTTVDSVYGTGARAVSQPLPNTDYTANSLASGLGTDVTSVVTVKDWSPRGGGFSITFNNRSRETVVLRGPGTTDGFIIRGQPVEIDRGSQRVDVKTDAPIIGDQEWEDSWQFFTNQDQLARFARFRASVFSELQRRTLADIELLEEVTGSYPIWLLQQDIGDKVIVRNTEGFNASGIDQTMVVDQISLRAQPPEGYTSVRWGLLSEDLALASGGVIGRDALSSLKRGTW